LTESAEKKHSRIETRRSFVFEQLESPYKPQQWKGLRSFVVLESDRSMGNKTTHKQRFSISSLAPDSLAIGRAENGEYSRAAPLSDESLRLVPDQPRLRLDYVRSQLLSDDFVHAEGIAQVFLKDFLIILRLPWRKPTNPSAAIAFLNSFRSAKSEFPWTLPKVIWVLGVSPKDFSSGSGEYA
jgi:hypothetical protein